MEFNFDTEIKKYGNSHVLTIPPYFVKKFNLESGLNLSILISGGDV